VVAAGRSRQEEFDCDVSDEQRERCGDDAAKDQLGGREGVGWGRRLIFEAASKGNIHDYFMCDYVVR